MSEHVLPDRSGFFVAEIGEPYERPPLRVLNYVSPAAFGPRHLEHLERLARHSTDGTSAVEWALRIAKGEVWLWEVSEIAAPKQPIVLVSTMGLPPTTLFIEGAAGDGIMANATDIVADLCTIAREYGAFKLQAYSGRDGFASLPDKLGFRAVATVWELETDDGQQAAERDDDYQ